jgi:hypothetical protein
MAPHETNYDKMFKVNIITTLYRTNISKVKEGHDDDDNDTNIVDEIIEAPNESDYHESQP